MAKTESHRSKQTKYKVKEPAMYNVVMHNDDVTTMEFVVFVLMRIFHKTYEDAETIMLKIHNEGSAIVGTYYRDIAETKVRYTTDFAKSNGFPLLLTIEEA